MTPGGFSQTSAAEQQLLQPERRPWPVWPWVLLLIGMLAVGLVYSFVPPAPLPNGDKHAAVGQHLPVFHLEPLTGESQTVTEDNLQGKITLINFWGPWCVACAIEAPHLVDLERHFHDNPDFQFFSVSSNADPFDDKGLEEGTEIFLKHFGAEFPTYRDPRAATQRGVAQLLADQPFGNPASVLLGPMGAIRGLWIGYSPGDENALRAAIEKGLAELPKKP